MNRLNFIVIFLLIIFLFCFVAEAKVICKKGAKMTATKKILSIKSPAFADKEFIPRKYAGEGENLNPPLIFDKIPPETKSLVLVVDDPDAPAGTFDHWIVYNVPQAVRTINEGEVPAGAVLGRNSAGGSAYTGPYPPPGKAHRYFFKLYALDTVLNLREGESKEKVEKAMQGHILGEGSMFGLYRR